MSESRSCGSIELAVSGGRGSKSRNEVNDIVPNVRYMRVLCES